MIKFLANRWFLVLLIALLVLGVIFGPRLAPLTKLELLRELITAAVLFLMALPLEASTIWNTFRRPWAAILATIINFVFIPLLAWALSFLFDPYLGGGLLVAASTPCTLASASVWTRKAGGNDAIATLVTVFTNMICFVVTPAWLTLMMGKSADPSPDLAFESMVLKLGKLVVFPMVLAQLLRLSGPIGRWSTQKKVLLNSVGQCGILYMVFIGAIQTGIRVWGEEDKEGIVETALMIATVAGIHVLALWLGMKLSAATKLPREDQIAVGFAGSQKTLIGRPKGFDGSRRKYRPYGQLSHRATADRYPDRRSLRRDK